MKKNKIRIDIFVILFIFIIGLAAGTIFDVNKTIYQINSPDKEFSRSTINLVAVNNDGDGIAIPLTVEARVGNGKTLTNIDKLLFWVDTQYSIQTAKSIAKNITGVNTDDFDLLYLIDANETGIVGGPSAGAALTIATIGALENRTLKDYIMITGTIEPDGTIGQVGGVLEKAQAAKEAGAQLFLVPSGQGTETKLNPVKDCQDTGFFTYCQIKYEKETVSVGEKTGIATIEVNNINDAIKYFY